MTLWNPIETAPKDRPILLWFPDGQFACSATWQAVEDGYAWIVADELSEQHDGVVWAESAQPTLWTEIPKETEET